LCRDTAIGICQSPWDAEHNHPHIFDGDVDLATLLYVNCGGVFTAGHNVHDRYISVIVIHRFIVIIVIQQVEKATALHKQ
jgi:hypothetical protein